VAYLLAPVATWASESDEDPLYLSDLDDIDDIDDDGGHKDPQRFFGRAPTTDIARKYGLRFTIDGV
jgi:hypothetical protein